MRELAAKQARFAFKARLFSLLRAYFEAHGFMEVITPSLIGAPAPEEYIEAPPVPPGLFLRSSPELQMKRLLAAGYEKIYQMGPCFRQGERGRLHREEFTMLEWYQAGADYEELLEFTRGMLISAVTALHGSGPCPCGKSTIDFTAPWCVLSVRDAFEQFADTSPKASIETNCFEEVLVSKVEPALPKDRPVVLKDYPARLGAFARLKKDDPSLAERWELYLGGVEIANAYGELTEPAEQRRRFALFNATRQSLGQKPYPEATEFLAALDAGIPPSAGCALGLERLAMILSGSERLDEVMFPEEALH
ncbi:MAG: hypothetical protein A2X49_15730 [Lentisphaerae bacterium GWF2_52_8]|nr:MAG: hypothetical protein A2X49_15730 [Lentisphaerae bacterium GWF2_52_8]